MSSFGSAPPRLRKFDDFISSPITSITTFYAKICLHYINPQDLKTYTGNNCAGSPNLAPKSSPHSRRARQTCRRAFTSAFPLKHNSVLPSTTLLQACATLPFAATCAVNVLDSVLHGRRLFNLLNPPKFSVLSITCLHQLPPHSRPCMRCRQILHTLLRRLILIAQCQRKCTTATQATRFFVRFKASNDVYKNAPSSPVFGALFANPRGAPNSR